MHYDFEVKIWTINSQGQFQVSYISFQSMRSQKFNALNGTQIRIETKKLWSFEDNQAKLKDHFEMIF